MDEKECKNGQILLTRLIETMFQLELDIKMFHWQSELFAHHKVSDELFGSIITLTDKLVEGICGAYAIRPKLTPNINLVICNVVSCNTISDKLINACCILREKNPIFKLSEIANIRDEILDAINKALYLLSFK